MTKFIRLIHHNNIYKGGGSDIKMSGKIEFITKKGISKDPKYDFYEYWAWRVIGEDDSVVELTQRYDQLMEIFKKIFAHEKKMNRERNRKPDATKWGQFIIKIMDEAKSNGLLEDYFKK